MANDLIHDRGRGPELVGTRITVYDLLPDLLDPTATEAYISRVYSLTPEQVAAARAYILSNLEAVLAQHLKIEGRIAKGNPPDVVDRLKRTHETFIKFKQWIENRTAEDAADRTARTAEQGTAKAIPSFREWLAEEAANSMKAS